MRRILSCSPGDAVCARLVLCACSVETVGFKVLYLTLFYVCLTLEWGDVFFFLNKRPNHFQFWRI